jgi:hypothetical protein
MNTRSWRYEAATKTIRDNPGNHWIATMDSWDAAVDHAANARLIASAPDLLAMLERVTDELRLLGNLSGMGNNPKVIEARALIAQIKGE